MEMADDSDFIIIQTDCSDIGKLFEEHEWSLDDDFLCVWQQQKSVPLHEIMVKLEAERQATAAKRAKEIPERKELKSISRLMKSMTTIQAVMDRPPHMPPQCVHVRSSFPMLKREGFIYADCGTGPRALVQHLKRGKCPTCPGATLEMVHKCFNDLLTSVYAMNYDPELLVKYKGYANGDVPTDKKLGFGSDRYVMGPVQWAKDRIPWVYCFTAFTTVIRLLCCRITIVPVDNLPVLLHAIVHLMLRQDEGVYGDVGVLSAIEKHNGGLFSGKQMMHMALTLFQALDFQPPLSVDDMRLDDIIYFNYTVQMISSSRRAKNDTPELMDPGKVWLDYFELKVFQHWVTRDNTTLQLTDDAFCLLFENYRKQSEHLDECVRTNNKIQ